jgi:acyl carrier protein
LLSPSPLEDAELTEEATLDRLRAIIAEVIGEEYVAEIEIERETLFYADLEIESIEFVALGEALQDLYGERIDFPAWIAGMEVDDIIAMTVGQLVDLILGSEPTAASSPTEPGDHG